jgi:TonB-linked SusC/RagA family outer membrane protein
VKGSSRGTTTNANGEFSIEANKGEVLVFSYVGFQTEEVVVGDNRTITVVLVALDNEMSEVFVTALGIRRESKRLGYSIAKVDGESLTQAREINVANGLVGKISGGNVSGVNGGPGSSSNIVIRGVNSFGGGQPLYVINGVPMDNSNRGSAGMWGGADMGDGISNINPDDIEEISVLKGSTASALYGSRASNGVILITTKSGKNKKGIGVEVNSNFTLDNIVDYTEYQYTYGQGLLGAKPSTQASAYQSGANSWGALIDGSNTVQFDGVARPYSAQKDNLSGFYKTGTTATNSIALTGGNENGNFRLSASTLNNRSVVPNSGLNRNTFNLNINGQLTKRLLITAIVNYLIEKSDNRPNLSDSPGNSNFGIAFLPTTLDQAVLKPGFMPNGNEINFSSNIFVTNPWFAASRWVNDLSRHRVLAMGSAKYNFTDWLFAQARVGQDFFNDRSTGVTPTGTAYSPGGGMNESSNRFTELNADFLVGADKNFSDFGVGVSVGGNLMKRNFESVLNTGAEFSIPFLYVLDNAKNKNSDYGLFRKEVQSLYYTAEFSYRNFLFLNTTGREDWFSTLPAENNHLFYPSVSGSFIFSEFLKPSWLNYGKLRLAWANTSGDTEPYQTQLYYGIAGNINGFPIGTIINSSIPNAALQPYRMTEFEAGVEARFFGSRLGIDVSWFKRKTDKEIVSVPASITSGYTGATINIGEMENKGIEALITGTILDKGGLRWVSSFNITKVNNKVVKLSEGQTNQALAQSRTQNAFIHHIVGMPAAQVMAFDYRRDASGAIVFDSDGRPLQGTLIPMGSGFHDVFGGWNNEFSFKGFSAGVLIDFKSGGKIFSATNNYATIFGLHQMTLAGRENGVLGDGVNEQGGKNAVTEDAWDYYGALATRVSSQFVYDASFIKLRQVILGYDLPKKIFGKTPIQGVRIALVARNLAILKKHTPNVDPESNYNNSVAQGLELAGVPPFRSFGMNVNVRF